MDTTGLVVDILADALDVNVSTEVPLQRPERMALVALDGDRSDEFVLRPRYAITCWGRTDVDAHGIAMSALHALTDAAETDPYLFAAEMEDMARDEWGRNGQARYVLTVDLTINIPDESE